MEILTKVVVFNNQFLQKYSVYWTYELDLS